MWSASMPGVGQQLGRLARSGQMGHRQLDHAGPLVRIGEDAQDGVADPALGPVVLDDDQPPAGGAGGGRPSVSASIGLTE